MTTGSELYLKEGWKESVQEEERGLWCWMTTKME